MSRYAHSGEPDAEKHTCIYWALPCAGRSSWTHTLLCIYTDVRIEPRSAFSCRHCCCLCCTCRGSRYQHLSFVVVIVILIEFASVIVVRPVFVAAVAAIVVPAVVESAWKSW